MDDKIYYELDSAITNLKKMQEQLNVLHRQRTEKIQQANADESLNEAERQGKLHEFNSLYDHAVRTIMEEFPKKSAAIEDKIAAQFNSAYFNEVDIDQKIIALESKNSPYTIHDQTAAILGLSREIRKNNLAKEIAEGDYTDLLNLYRIALRTNNRTDLAYIESRIEKLTRKAGKNSKDNSSKTTLLELVKNSVMKRVDPKICELKDRFDTITKEHDQIITEIDEDNQGDDLAQKVAQEEKPEEKTLAPGDNVSPVN
ncbi:MAG: hypothetical protein ACMUIS_11185 [bacterium]